VADPKRCGNCPCPNTGHTQDDGTCMTIGCKCPRYTPPTGTWPLMDSANKIHGTPHCVDCMRPLVEGAPYSERLEGIAGDMEIVEIVCVYCSLPK